MRASRFFSPSWDRKQREQIDLPLKLLFLFSLQAKLAVSSPCRQSHSFRQRKTHSQPMGKKEKQNWRQEKYYKPLLDTNVSHRTARQQRAYDGGVGGWLCVTEELLPDTNVSGRRLVLSSFCFILWCLMLVQLFNKMLISSNICIYWYLLIWIFKHISPESVTWFIRIG